MAEDDPNGILIQGQQTIGESTLYDVLNRLISAIFFPDPNSGHASAPLLQRIKASLSVNIPLLRDASRNSGRRVLVWTRRGGTFRALLVVSSGTIVVVTLTGLLVFMLFFVSVTCNSVVISLLMSLAAAGGFLALLFAFVAAIYVGALSVALFVISAAAISSVIAVLIATDLSSSNASSCSSPVVSYTCRVEYLEAGKSMKVFKNVGQDVLKKSRSVVYVLQRRKEEGSMDDNNGKNTDGKRGFWSKLLPGRGKALRHSRTMKERVNTEVH